MGDGGDRHESGDRLDRLISLFCGCDLRRSVTFLNAAISEVGMDSALDRMLRQMGQMFFVFPVLILFEHLIVLGKQRERAKRLLRKILRGVGS